MKLKFAIALAIALPVAAYAQSSQGPSWNYAGVGYATMELDAPGSAADGFKMGGLGAQVSGLVTDNVFVQAGFSKLTKNILVNDLEMSQINFDVGVRFPLNASTDVWASIGYIDSELTYAGISLAVADDYPFSAGIRSKVTPKLEFRTAFTTVDGDTTYSIGADYEILDKTDLVVSYSRNDLVSGILVGVKVPF